MSKNNDKDAIIKAFQSLGITIKPAYRIENGIPYPNWLSPDGKECIEGIYEGIPNELYHQAPDSFSNSQLKVFRDSPAHYWHKYLDPEREPEPEKRPDYFVAGDLIHALCLEPDEVYERYYCALNEKDYPTALRTAADIEAALKTAGQPMTKKGEKKADKVARLKECCPDIQVWDDLVEQHARQPENEDKQAIPYSIWKKAHRALAAVKKRAEADFLLSEGLAELSIFARCPGTGLMLRIRPDWLRLNKWIIDVKSTASAKPAYWSKQASSLGYHCQDAFYKYVFNLAAKQEAAGFGFITIEYDKAAICEPYEVHEDDKHAGEEIIANDINRLALCLEKDYWPGYTEEGVTPLRIAHYAKEVNY